MDAFLERDIEGLNLDRSDWQLVKFGDVAIQQKQTVDRENTDLTRYVKGEHMYSEDLHLREWGELKDEYLGPAFIRKFEEGDILYGSRRTYLRKVVIAPFDGITSNTTFVIKANEERVDKRLLPFIMLSEGFSQHSIRNSKGSVNPYVNWKDLSGYEFLLPPKEQQAELAELLWAMDEVVEKAERVSRVLPDSVASIFKEAISESQEDVALIEVGEIITGSTPLTNNTDFWENGTIPFVTPAEFNEAPYIEDAERTITRSGLDAVRAIPKDAVLVVSIGATIGKVAITKSTCATNQQINAVVVGDNYSPIYVMLALRFFKQRILARAGATTLPIINKGEFSKVRIPNISPAKSAVLDSRFAELERASILNNTMSQKTKTLQKSLTNQVF